jgi:hypothetical protein
MEVVDAYILQLTSVSTAGQGFTQNNGIGRNTTEMDMIATLDNFHGLISRYEFDWFHNKCI